MIDSIASQASALANQGQAAAASRATKSADTSAIATQSPAVSEQSAAVTVELSAQAQAKELKSEGMSVTEIATKLKLDEKTVDSYLGLQA